VDLLDVHICIAAAVVLHNLFLNALPATLDLTDPERRTRDAQRAAQDAGQIMQPRQGACIDAMLEMDADE